MQLDVRSFFAVKSGKMPLAEAVDAKRKLDSEREEQKEAKRKATAKALARQARPAPGASKQPARKVICAHDLEKDSDGRLKLPPDCLYIGSAYRLNEGMGWAGASHYAIPKDLRAQERPFGQASKLERDADRRVTLAELRRRLEKDSIGLERMARELAGKRLVCWCYTDDLCHGPLMLELVEAEWRRQADADKFGAIRIPSFSK